MELVDIDKKELKITAEKSGEKEVKEEITSWLDSYQQVPTWSVSGEIKGSIENVDFYDDGEQTGKKTTASGSISFGFAALEAPLMDIPFAGGAITVKPNVSFDRLQVKFELSLERDDSKEEPWVAGPEGSISGSTGFSIAATVQFGTEFLNVSVSGEASSEVTATGAVRLSGQKKVEISDCSLTAGELTLTFSVEAKVTVVQVTLYEKEGTFPESGALLDWSLSNPILIHEF